MSSLHVTPAAFDFHRIGKWSGTPLQGKQVPGALGEMGYVPEEV